MTSTPPNPPTLDLEALDEAIRGVDERERAAGLVVPHIVMQTSTARQLYSLAREAAQLRTELEGRSAMFAELLQIHEVLAPHKHSAEESYLDAAHRVDSELHAARERIGELSKALEYIAGECIESCNEESPDCDRRCKICGFGWLRERDQSHDDGCPVHEANRVING